MPQTAESLKWVLRQRLDRPSMTTKASLRFGAVPIIGSRRMRWYWWWATKLLAL